MHIYKANTLSVKNTKHMYVHTHSHYGFFARPVSARQKVLPRLSKENGEEGRDREFPFQDSKASSSLYPPLSYFLSFAGGQKATPAEGGIGIPGTQFGRILF